MANIPFDVALLTSGGENARFGNRIHIGDKPPCDPPEGFEWRCYESKTEREVRINGGKKRWYPVASA